MDGKAASRRNAVRHGVLTSVVIADDEDPEMFANLVAELTDEFQPVGPTETLLVEKVALSMWRNRRLALAERAKIDGQRSPRKVARDVSEMMDCLYSSGRLSVEDLEPIEESQLEWCRKVVEQAPKARATSPENWAEAAPAIEHQVALERDDPDEAEGLKIALASPLGAQQWLADLEAYCRGMIEQGEEMPERLRLAERARAQAATLPIQTQLLFSRYQTSLDNQLTKALTALHDAQEARLKRATIDLSPEVTEPLITSP